MNITVTGANGFLGKNLINHLIFKKNINLFKVTRETSDKELKKYLLKSDIIYHFAAINRPGKGESYSDNIVFTKNIFLFNDEIHWGIDNIYIGNVNTMYKLINMFFYKLDDILIKNNDTINQERLVYRINNTLFD